MIKDNVGKVVPDRLVAEKSHPYFGTKEPSHSQSTDENERIQPPITTADSGALASMAVWDRETFPAAGRDCFHRSHSLGSAAPVA
jgi:hypothetical protein